MSAFDVLYINTDIMPGTLKTANSRLSYKAALAHELVGHRAAALVNKTFFNSKYSEPLNNLLEEIQSSIRASELGKDLSKIERDDLLMDAKERFESYNALFTNTELENYTFIELKKILWLD